MEKLIKKIKSLSDNMRPVPFWYWNGAPQPENVARTVNLMAGAGYGGSIVCTAGCGVDPAGDLFFECADAYVAESRKNGMETWFCADFDPEAAAATLGVYEKLIERYPGLTGIYTDIGGHADDRIKAAYVLPLKKLCAEKGVLLAGALPRGCADVPLVPGGGGTDTVRAASAALHDGAKRVFVRGFEGADQDSDLETLKFLAEKTLVRGAGAVCPSRQTYALSPDSPVGAHQSWWGEAGLLSGYLSRVSALLSMGENAADALVFDDKTPASDELCDLLSSLGAPFGTADSRDVENSASDGGRLTVGGAKYKTVFIPAGAKMTPAAANALDAFMKNGGGCVSVGEGENPLGCPSVPRDPAALLAYIAEKGARRVEVTCRPCAPGAVERAVRDLGGVRAYYFLNTDTTRACRASVRLYGEKYAVRLRPDDLALLRVRTFADGDALSFDLDLAPMQSYFIIASENELPEGEKATRTAAILDLGSEWELEKADLNTLPLTAENGEKGDVRYVFEVEREFKFASCENFRLVTPYADRAEVYVNGKRVFYNGYSWWKDPSLCSVDIKNFAEGGENEIVIRGGGEKPAYIVGNFGVGSRAPYVRAESGTVCTRGPFYIRELPRAVPGGRLAEAGFPFFSGAVTLTRNLKIKKNYGEKIRLTFQKPRAALCRIYVNGKKPLVFPWADYSAEVTELVKRGDNRLSAELFIGSGGLFAGKTDGLYRLYDAGI